LVKNGERQRKAAAAQRAARIRSFALMRGRVGVDCRAEGKVVRRQ